jgi:hypothetical protein
LKITCYIYKILKAIDRRNKETVACPGIIAPFFDNADPFYPYTFPGFPYSQLSKIKIGIAVRKSYFTLTYYI